MLYVTQLCRGLQVSTRVRVSRLLPSLESYSCHDIRTSSYKCLFNNEERTQGGEKLKSREEKMLNWGRGTRSQPFPDLSSSSLELSSLHLSVYNMAAWHLAKACTERSVVGDYKYEICKGFKQSVICTSLSSRLWITVRRKQFKERKLQRFWPKRLQQHHIHM